MRILLILLCGAACAQGDELLDWMNRAAERQLDRREAAIRSLQSPAEAQARQKQVKATLLRLLGALPETKAPLRAQVTGTVEKPGYVIEKVVFESLPGWRVPANVYRPAAAGRYPGVLISIGHWDEGKAAAQRIAANLALKGFVAIAYDPFGQGERVQERDALTGRSLTGGATDQHIVGGAEAMLTGRTVAAYMIHDGMRALDYLISRPDVDGERIGATGCSGGGTLTAYLAALDDRIRVAAPACYVNTWRKLFPGPTGDSEQSIPGFLAAGLDLPDWVELFAPKPYLIASTEQDFFPLEGARHAYDEARGFYGHFGAADKIRWVVGPGGHGTPLVVREAIYEWMIRWLRAGKGDAREQAVEMLPEPELWAGGGAVGGRSFWQLIGPGPLQLPAGAAAAAPDAPEPTVVMRYPKKLPAAAIVLVGMPEEDLQIVTDMGYVACSLTPAGWAGEPRTWAGDWLTNTRAQLIGYSLPLTRAQQIRRLVVKLSQSEEVRGLPVYGAARGIAGLWLRASADSFRGLWLDRAPDIAAALSGARQRGLHEALLPTAGRAANEFDTDPVNWGGGLLSGASGAAYRYFEESDAEFLRKLVDNRRP